MPVPLSKNDFADNQFINGYQSLFATAWRIDVNNGLDITSGDYKFVCCILGFDTSPSLCHGEPQKREKNQFLFRYWGSSQQREGDVYNPKIKQPDL